MHNRFYGRIAEQADRHEEGILEAIKHNAGGLLRVSGERIWSELRKILEGKFAGDLMKVMLSLGIGPHIGKLDLPLIICHGSYYACFIDMYSAGSKIFFIVGITHKMKFR